MAQISIKHIQKCIEELSKGLKEENKLLRKVFNKNSASLDLSHYFQSDSVPSTYSIDKFLLEKLFNNTKDTLDGIYTRLLVLDSTYSTQMTRRYYALGELAEAIYLLSSKQSLRKNLMQFARYCGKEKYDVEELFSYNKKECVLFFDSPNGFKDSPNGYTNLFKEGFGTGKDKDSKGVATSLITKYAYFLTNKLFPIYDSIVRETLPIIWRNLGQKGPSPVNKSTQDITTFVKGINDFRKLLNNEFSYDEIDMFLWHLGKAMRGNFSLVLSMNDYMKPGFRTVLTNKEKSDIERSLKSQGLKNNSLKAQLKKSIEAQENILRIKSSISKIESNQKKEHLVSTFKLAITLLE